jgi:AcrR family transcriptional regulator
MHSRTAQRGRPPDPGLRARRREQILDAAAHAFAREGYAGLDLEVLARSIGVGKGTLYRYFRTKETLFLAAIDRMMRALDERIEAEAALAASPLDRISRGVHAYLAHFDAHPELVELIVLERAVFKDRRKPTYFRYRDSCDKPWRELVRELIARGDVRDVPVDRVADVFSYLLYGTIFTNHFAGRTKSFVEQAQDVLDVAFWGIRTGPRPGAQWAPR